MTDIAAPEPSDEPIGDSDQRRIVIITGLAGSGMSTALKMLEDLGYEAVDNLPLSVVPTLVGERQEDERPLAMAIDSRTRDFSAANATAMLQGLTEDSARRVDFIFMECDTEILRRRYTETRRRHHLAVDRPVQDGIKRDRQLLEPLREHADIVVDTSISTIHDLRRQLAERFALDRQPGLYVFVTSFAFRRGLPREADLVFDVRFLDNPHWDPELRDLTGLDKPVQFKVSGDPEFPGFFVRLTALLQPLLPLYNREGKSYLTIAVGCTGGKHRSVFTSELLASWLRDEGYRVGIAHRDMPRKA